MQARPLQLNGRFIELLQSPTKLGLVQALSGKSAGRATNQFVTDRISTRTLNSVLTHDPTSVEHARWFSKDYNLTWGQNLVKKYFDMIGLHEWMDERQEVILDPKVNANCKDKQTQSLLAIAPEFKIHQDRNLGRSLSVQLHYFIFRKMLSAWLAF